MRGLAQDTAFFFVFWLLTGPPLAAVAFLASRLPFPLALHFALVPVYWLVFIALMLAMAWFLRLLFPKLVPGRYPFPSHKQSVAWMFHFGLQRVANLPLWSYLIFGSSSLRWLYFRALGARAPFDMQSSMDIVVTDPWLLEIGPGSMLAAGVLVSGHFVENGQLLLDRVRIGAGAQLHGNVTLAPGVCVGPNTVIGPGSTLLPGVTVGADSHIGLGCLLFGGVRVGENVVVGHQAVLEANVTVGDGAVVESGTRIPKGTIVLDGEHYPPKQKLARQEAR